MRKILDSSKAPRRISLSFRAEARSVPNGFSTMTRALGVPELLADGLEGRSVLVVAVHVAEERGELGEGRRIDAPAVLLQAVLGARLELIQPPARLGHPDHRHVEVATLDHSLERGKDLLVREVASGPKEDQRVGMCGAHVPAGFSRWPPNS